MTTVQTAPDAEHPQSEADTRRLVGSYRPNPLEVDQAERYANWSVVIRKAVVFTGETVERQDDVWVRWAGSVLMSEELEQFALLPRVGANVHDILFLEQRVQEIRDGGLLRHRIFPHTKPGWTRHHIGRVFRTRAEALNERGGLFEKCTVEGCTENRPAGYHVRNPNLSVVHRAVDEICNESAGYTIGLVKRGDGPWRIELDEGIFDVAEVAALTNDLRWAAAEADLMNKAAAQLLEVDGSAPEGR